MPSPFPNLGLVQRALRETYAATIMLSGVLFAISGLLAYALPRVQARFMERNRMPPQVRAFRDAMLGTDSSLGSVADIAYSIALSHPIVIALLAAHAIIVTTRILAAEVERGTVDVLLALPVTRIQLFVSETFAWLLTGLVAIGAVYGGSYFGSRFIPVEYRPDFGNMLLVMVNLALVYAVIGTSGLFAGVMTDRRTRAVLFVVLMTIFSVLVNFLYTLDPSLAFTKNLRFLSVLEYYKPVAMLRAAEFPWKDAAVLGGAAIVLWTLAAVRMSRRDVTTL
jgi:ABC-2 type transport system permease protein